jgi:hypothetical protein
MSSGEGLTETASAIPQRARFDVMMRCGWLLLAPTIAVVLLVGLGADRAQPAKDNCATCHLEIGDDRLTMPANAFADDIHKAKGFGCVAFHGGDANDEGMEAMSRAKGFVGKPTRQQIPRSAAVAMRTRSS